MNIKFRKKLVVEYLLSFFLAFYFYSAKFVFLPIDTSKLIWLLFLLFFIFTLFFSSAARYVLSDFIYPLIISSVFLYFGLSLLLFSVISDADNVTFPLYVILYFLDVTLVAFSLTVLFSYLRFNIQNILNVIINVGFIQAVMMFSMLLIPEWNNLYKSITITNSLISSYYEYRYVGLTGFANYTVGIMQGLFFLVALVSYYEERKFSLSRCIILITIFISSMLASRSSLVLICIGFIIFFLTNLSNKYFFKKILPWIVFSLFSAFTLIYFCVTNEELLSNNILLKWALEPFYNFVHYGELRTNSSDTIENYYFRPSDNTFYWGDWKYVNQDGSYYMHVDAGYMRLLLYMGLYFSLAFYSFFTFIYLLNFYILRNMFNAVIKNIDVLYISVLLSFFIFQYKGNIFVDGFGVLKVITLLLIINHSKILARR